MNYVEHLAALWSAVDVLNVTESYSPLRLDALSESGFCFVATQSGNCVAMATEYGHGRVLVLSDQTLWTDVPIDEDRQGIIQNSLRWLGFVNVEADLCDDSDASTLPTINSGDFNECRRSISIGVIDDNSSVSKVLDDLESSIISKATGVEDLDALFTEGYDVMIWMQDKENTYEVEDATILGNNGFKILSYIHQGGSILIVVDPAAFQTATGKLFNDYSLMGQVLERCGIRVSSLEVTLGAKERAYSLGTFKTVEYILTNPYHYVIEMINLILDNVDGNVITGYLSKILSIYETLPLVAPSNDLPLEISYYISSDNGFSHQLTALMAKLGKEVGSDYLNYPLSTKAQSSIPLTLAAAYLYQCFLGRAHYEIALNDLNEYIPRSYAYPGPVTSTNDKTEGFKVSILDTKLDRQALGVYAAPGDVIVVTIKDEAYLNKGYEFTVYIGLPSDKLEALSLTDSTYSLARPPVWSHGRKWRPEEVVSSPTMSFTTTDFIETGNKIALSSPFGGPLLIKLEVGIDDVTTITSPSVIPFEVDGAYPMIYYSSLKREEDVFSTEVESYPHWSTTFEELISQYNGSPLVALEGSCVTLYVSESVVAHVSQSTIELALSWWDDLLQSATATLNFDWVCKHAPYHIYQDVQIDTAIISSENSVSVLESPLFDDTANDIPYILDTQTLDITPPLELMELIANNIADKVDSFEYLKVGVKHFIMWRMLSSKYGTSVYDCYLEYEQTNNILTFLKNNEEETTVSFLNGASYIPSLAFGWIYVTWEQFGEDGLKSIGKELQIKRAIVSETNVIDQTQKMIRDWSIGLSRDVRLNSAIWGFDYLDDRLNAMDMWAEIQNFVHWQDSPVSAVQSWLEAAQQYTEKEGPTCKYGSVYDY